MMKALKKMGVTVVLLIGLGHSASATEQTNISKIELPIDYQVAKTCKYMDNLAFVDLRNSEFTSPYVQIARACKTAWDIRRLSLNGSESQNLADDYLIGVVEFRNELIGLSAQKFWEARSAVSKNSSIGQLNTMNKTSFYLLAKQYGLFTRHEAMTKSFESAYYPVWVATD